MAAMSRASAWADRWRGTNSPSLAVGWVLALLAVLLCCSTSATAAPRTDAPSASTVRAFTPVQAAVVSVVVADAPGERGIGSSCHGATDHSTAVVLPGHPAPAAPPCPAAAPGTGPFPGSGTIRGPSHDGAGAVDRQRLQVQRI